MSQLFKTADRVSLGELEALDLKRESRDEIGSLTHSISRMRTSLVQAMKMLES